MSDSRLSPQGQNLEAIHKALDGHAERCSNPPVEIRMAPFEVQRLDWDDYRGIPIVGDPDMSTGRVRIVCAPEGLAEREEIVEAVSA